MSESCSSRHFSWLMKSCFPNPNDSAISHPSTTTTTTTAATPTSISSLPDDLLLECLSRVSPCSLPSLPLVSRRWSLLLHSPSFYSLRHLHSHLRHSLFAFSLSHSSVHSSSLLLSSHSSWKTSSFPIHSFFSSRLSFLNSFSHSRLAAIGRRIFLIGRCATLEFDAWTGTVIPRPGMLVPRKKFAAAPVSGKIYVAGGSSRAESVEEYDPATGMWSKVADAPRSRYGCIGASVDGVFYVIGGLKIGSSGSETSSLVSGAEAHLYAGSMDLFDVEKRSWLRSRAVPGGGCVVAACAADDAVYVLTSHAVELSFWRFGAARQSGGGFGDWSRLRSPPLPAQVRLDGTVRFSFVGAGERVVLVQVTGCIDDLLRRSGRSARGWKDKLVLVYDCRTAEWSRGVDLPDVIRRAACISVEC